MQVNQLKPGTVLVGRYEIVKRIGGGGMGNVYQAKDKRLADAPRAVKEMIGMFTDEASRRKAIEDFERESQVLASLDHSAIPTIFDYFVDEGNYYLVMKLITGGDLGKKLYSSPMGRIDERTVTEWAIQICDVLSYLHKKDPPIIYRDLKPANIMLDERGKIVLVDFGIARFVAPTQKNVTAIGTMGYAPPELFSGKVNPRSDIYSLGATMFHLLTGKDPQDNPLLIFDFTKNPRPRQINPELTEGIEKIVAKAVEYKHENRFTSADEMKKALEEHLRKLEAGTTAQLAVTYGVIVRSGDRSVKLLLLKEANMFGRLDTNRGIFPDIDLTPYDLEGKVSRRHAMIHISPQGHFLEDLGSTNGTFLNGGRMIPREKRLLRSGDQIRMGEIEMKFFVEEVVA
ncbi:MAG: FHA domain-containing serine/threonine-protein kinase [Acidobacteriota bacterium]|nr:FHA domain-containing serine/threonine-protein kinase [Blastocatellia bacterium]MDW8411748.1 FHA domain-containing serine/threonine-protein kinase [Acidobacteriota bacterium]